MQKFVFQICAIYHLKEYKNIKISSNKQINNKRQLQAIV